MPQVISAVNRGIAITSMSDIKLFVEALRVYPSRIQVVTCTGVLVQQYGFEIYIDDIKVIDLHPNDNYADNVMVVEHQGAYAGQYTVFVLGVLHCDNTCTLRFSSPVVGSNYVLDTDSNYVELKLADLQGVIYRNEEKGDPDFEDQVWQDIEDCDTDVGPIDDDLEDFAHAP
jgi:hypothetical protein